MLSHRFSCVWPFATLWTVAHQPPLSMGFSRQEYWSGLKLHLQGIFPTQGSNPSLLLGRWILYHWATKEAYRDYACACAQLCLILCDPINCSPPGSSVRGIFQERIGEWVAISFSRGSSQPRDGTHVFWDSCTGGWVLTSEPPGKCVCTYKYTCVYVCIRVSMYVCACYIASVIPDFLQLYGL